MGGKHDARASDRLSHLDFWRLVAPAPGLAGRRIFGLFVPSAARRQRSGLAAVAADRGDWQLLSTSIVRALGRSTGERYPLDDTTRSGAARRGTRL